MDTPISAISAIAVISSLSEIIAVMSISVTSMLLGFAIACGGLMCFSNAANGIESGMAAIMEALPPDAGDLAGAMCAESNIATDGVSESDKLREACGILDAAGREIDDEISARALQILAQRVNDLSLIHI